MFLLKYPFFGSDVTVWASGARFVRGAATQARAFTLDAVLPCYLYTAITFSVTSSKFVVKIKKKYFVSFLHIYRGMWKWDNCSKIYYSNIFSRTRTWVKYSIISKVFSELISITTQYSKYIIFGYIVFNFSHAIFTNVSVNDKRCPYNALPRDGALQNFQKKKHILKDSPLWWQHFVSTNINTFFEQKCI